MNDNQDRVSTFIGSLSNKRAIWCMLCFRKIYKGDEIYLLNYLSNSIFWDGLKKVYLKYENLGNE